MKEDMEHVSYRFRMGDGAGKRFDYRFRRDSFELVMDSSALPEWAALGFHQCPHCSLASGERAFCPLSLSIVDVVHGFDELPSHAEVCLEVVTGERSYSKKTSVQSGMSSLMGLLMAASGCPYTAPFRPMARFHLPFATAEETAYRVISMFVTALFVNGREAKEDSLDGLNEIYRQAHIVNVCVAERRREWARTDSSVNALIVLDMFATGIPYFMSDALDRLRGLFFAYART